MTALALAALVAGAVLAIGGLGDDEVDSQGGVPSSPAQEVVQSGGEAGDSGSGGLVAGSAEARYAAYLVKVEEYQDRYGTHDLVMLGGQQWSVGLAMVQLVDFNGDGDEELLLAYRDSNAVDDSSYGYDRQAYHVEVWGIQDGAMSLLHSGIPPAGDGGYMPIILYRNENAQEAKVLLYEHESNGSYGEGFEGVTEYYGFDDGRFDCLLKVQYTSEDGVDRREVQGVLANGADERSSDLPEGYTTALYYLDGLSLGASREGYIDCDRVFEITDETVVKLGGKAADSPSAVSGDAVFKAEITQLAQHEILHWFYEDMDADGRKEVFAITGIQNEHYENEWSEGEVWFGDENGVKKVGGQEMGNALNGLVEDPASGYRFLSLEHDGHGSGTVSTVIAASNGVCTIALFDIDPLGSFHEENGRLVGYTQKWDNGFHEYEWHTFEFEPIGVIFESTGTIDRVEDGWRQ